MGAEVWREPDAARPGGSCPNNASRSKFIRIRRLSEIEIDETRTRARLKASPSKPHIPHRNPPPRAPVPSVFLLKQRDSRKDKLILQGFFFTFLR